MFKLSQPLVWRSAYDLARQRGVAGAVALVLLFAAAAFLVSYKLAYYPLVFFDEGWYLQIPQNLVEHGQYATYSSEGFRPHDTVVGVSPLFYLPMAAAFKIWGVGILPARAVVAACFLGACLFMFLVTRSLYGFRAGLIAFALFLLMGNETMGGGAVLLGRMVMGEIPALFALFAGIYCWLQAFEGRPTGRLIAAGALLGLAITIKLQFLLIIFPALVCLALIDRLYYGERRLQLYGLPFAAALAALGLHYLSLLALLGPEQFTSYLHEVSVASGPQVRTLLNPRATLHAIGNLLGDISLSWFFAGLAYAIVRSLPRGPEQIKHCMLWVLVGGWAAWFIVATPGWGRYLFPALAVGYILTARLWDDLIGLAWRGLAEARASQGRDIWAPAALAVGLGVMMAATLTTSAAPWLRDTLGAPVVNDQRTFAAYIDEHISPDDVVATWEWDIVSLTAHERYNMPPLNLLAGVIARTWMGSTEPPPTYDFMSYRPDYIVTGPFYPLSLTYRPEFLKERCTLVYSVGPYNLFRING